MTSGRKIVFYEPRVHNLVPIIASYQDIYDGKLELLSVSQPKRTGKALVNSTLLLTPDGDKPIGDMKVGDTVFGGDGLPAKVIGVYPQAKNAFLKSMSSATDSMIKLRSNVAKTIYGKQHQAKAKKKPFRRQNCMNTMLK